MEKVPNHERLYKRGNTYQYRFLIPAEMRAFFGGKSEIKKSLKTDSLKEAKVRWAIECEKTDRELADARHKLAKSSGGRRTPTKSEAWAMVRDWHTEQMERERLALASASIEDLPARLQHAREEQTAHAQIGFVRKFHPMADAVVGFLCERNDVQAPEPRGEVYAYMADLIHRARVDVLRRGIALMENDTNDHPAGIDRIFLERPGELQDPQPAATGLNPGSNYVAVPLGDAVEAYVNDPTRNAKDSTRRANRDKLSPLLRHFGADADLNKISSEDFEAWTRLLLRLPKNAAKRFPAGSLEEMVKAGEAVRAEPISRSNARGVQQSASSLIDHLVKRERLDRNRLKPHILPKTKFAKPTRRPFTVAELNTLFRQPVFTGCVDEERGFSKTGTSVPRKSRYWLPLIALFTGMRMGEIAQLWSDDIVEQDGVWAIRVQFNAERDQELKNPGSDRIIPIHRMLVDLGFVEWATKGRRSGASRLFPDIPKSKDKGDYSGVFSKRFSKFLETAGLWKDGRTFHSFRHNFRDAIRDADLTDGLAKVLGGWADDEPHNKYGRGHKIGTLKTAIDKLDFVNGEEQLDLTHLV